MKYLSYEGLAHLKLLIKNALNLKIDKEEGKGLSSNDYTTTEKTKLSGIEEGANKTTVDSELNGTSTNPVQNKTVYESLLNKVDKENGKGLSQNDLTDELLTKFNNTASKVDEIATVGGEPNVIEVIKKNGAVLNVEGKTVNITVPTNNNELANGAGYITGINKTNVTDALGYTPYNSTNPSGYQTESQVSTLIANAVKDIQGITYTVVTELPSTGEAGVIYLISNNGANPNIYDEYIYVNNKFEKIGTTDVDLNGYVQTSDIIAITNSEIDTVWDS